MTDGRHLGEGGREKGAESQGWGAVVTEEPREVGLADHMEFGHIPEDKRKSQKTLI